MSKRHLAGIRQFLASVPRAVTFYDGSVLRTAGRALVLLRRHGLKGLILRAKMLSVIPPSRGEHDIAPTALYHVSSRSGIPYRPKVSVVVPNFNHSKYLTERLRSIYGQTYENLEVILLDDASTDNSREVLLQFAEAHKEITKCEFNDTNSGSVFRQWSKGFELASGELVWIAESDDYCSPNFLEELVASFANPAVRLAFARTTFVRGNPASTCWSSEEYLADLGLKIWDEPFVMAAHSLVNLGWLVKNLVPNASGALFRHPGRLGLLSDAQWLSMRVCGDWMFYLSLIRGGLVAYSPKATNYYRQHDRNTSVNFQAEVNFFLEHAVVGRHLVQLFKLSKDDLERQREHLFRLWRLKQDQLGREEFDRLYDIEAIWLHAAKRKPNVLMAVYAFVAGGGETFPIMLANLLHAQGFGVTLFNFHMEPTEPGVRNMVADGIPVLELDRAYLAGRAFRDMGIEVVHSHHASIDLMLVNLLAMYPEIARVITMHGMYELMPAAQFDNAARKLEGRIHCFVYTADKNLRPFSAEFRERNFFTKIPNALARQPITTIARSELGLDDTDFVLCLVSRAIPEKGWQEAIDAVKWAHQRSQRGIQLLLIGEGPEFDRLANQGLPAFIHFLGFRGNIRDYFAAADMGFLPSRFKGESFPLVLIDCLFAGKPVLASDVGEIANMLSTQGGPAGEVFELSDWAIPTVALGETILSLANSPQRYACLLGRVAEAAEKFDPEEMVKKYEAVYQRCLDR